MSKKPRTTSPNTPATVPVLTEPQIDDLFDRFAEPLLQPCLTAHQQASGTAIAQVFWLRLISGTDTEEHLDQDLRQMGITALEDNSALGALYFHKMKPALTAREIAQLQHHYRFPVNGIPLWNAEFPQKRPRLH